MDNSFWSSGRSIAALVIVGVLSLAILFSHRKLRNRASRSPPGLNEINILPTDAKLPEENLDIEYGGLDLLSQAQIVKC
jgi:hypothetical protein